MENDKTGGTEDITVTASEDGKAELKTLGEPVRRRGKKKSFLRLELLVICAVVLIALIPLYIYVIKPMLTTETETEAPELIDDGNGVTGEVLYSGTGIAMVGAVDQANVLRYEIHNAKDDWGFTYNDSEEQYYLTGYSDAPYSYSDFVQFSVLCRGLETDKRLYTECEDFSVYGLDEASNPAYYKIILKSGACHTVYFGKPLPTGIGYYSRYSYTAEDGTVTERKALYVMGNSTCKYADMTLLDFLTPILTMTLDNENYFPTQFTVFHGVDVLVDIRKLTSEELKETENIKVFHVYTPDGCDYDGGVEFTSMLYDVLRPGIQGTRVVLTGSDAAQITDSQLAEYGIVSSAPDSWLHFKASIGSDTSGKPIEVEQDLLFSPMTGEGTYYCYVSMFDIVVEVKASDVDFMSWPVAEFAEDSVYIMYIANLSKITYDSRKVRDPYFNSGVPRVFESFSVVCEKGTTADGSEVDKVKSVTIGSTGKSPADTLDADGDKVTGIDNFKWLYASMIAVNVQFDISESDLAKVDLTRDADVTITVETIGGKVNTMEFYLYDSRHAYYVVNGKGRFFVIYDELTKILNGVTDVVNGVAVDYFAKN